MALNFKVIIEDVVKTSTLSASPALVSTLPVDNLKDIYRSNVAKSTSTATQTININFGAVKLIDSFALWRHNLTLYATLQLIIYSGANQTGTVVYDSGQFAAVKGLGWGDFIWGVDTWGGSVFQGDDATRAFTQKYFNGVYGLSARLIIQDLAPTYSFYQACRMYLGRSLAVSVPAIMPLSLGQNQTKELVRMESGISLPTKFNYGYRGFEINLNQMNQSEAFNLYNSLANVGINDVWVSLFPDDNAPMKERLFSGAARIENSVQIDANNNSFWYGSKMAFFET